MVRETEDAEADAARAVVEVEALRCAGAPVVADGDDATLVREALGVKDLRDGVGLLFVVVAVGVGWFRAAAESEEVGDDQWVAKGQECWNCAGPHVGVIWETMEENEDGGVG